MLEVYGKKNPDGSVTITRLNGKTFVKYAPWHTDKPDYRNKRVHLNCYNWRLVWIKEKEAAQC